MNPNEIPFGMSADTPIQSVIQPWAQRLPLRLQGVLVAAVRGCDVEPKDGATKTLTRFLRTDFLMAACGDHTKARSFYAVPQSDYDFDQEARRFFAADGLPHHFLMHVIHAAEILGYFHPDQVSRNRWQNFYRGACHRLHMTEETRATLLRRLTADEATFGASQDPSLIEAQ